MQRLQISLLDSLDQGDESLSCWAYPVLMKQVHNALGYCYLNMEKVKMA
jgi:hypothetical protein